MLKLNNNALFVLDRLHNCGHKAYAVGGCIRDMLMGREVNDYDITTSALPEEIKKAFPDYTTVETGIKHGTVTVIVNKQPFEITTFRTENNYSDLRHPDSVTFVKDVHEDLFRRDFTVNAIAYSPDEGIIDPCGGIEHIKSKTISCVGNAHKRFSEDSLRILRALRFASTLSFNIEEETSSAIKELAPNLCYVSAERLYEELKKLVSGNNAVDVIKEYKSVIQLILPINGNIDGLRKLPQEYCSRFACLCGADVVKGLKKLRADNKTIAISKLLALSKPIPAERIALMQYLSELGRENAVAVIKYRSALYGEDSTCAEEILSSTQCLSLKELKIGGNELLSMGVKGERVGIILGELLSSVISEKTENTKEALLELAKELVK